MSQRPRPSCAPFHPRRALVMAVAALTALASPLAGCAELPWGQGGLAPAYEDRAAVLRIHDPSSLALLGAELAARLEERLGGALTLSAPSPAANGAGVVDWNGVVLELGPVDLELPRTSSPAVALVARIELAAASQSVGLDLGEVRCAATLRVEPGTLILPLGLVADKLGRVQGLGRGAAEWLGPAPTLDLSACGLPIDHPLPDLGADLARVVQAPLQDALSTLTPTALGLDLALGLSYALGTDTLGAGFVRATLRGTEDALVEVHDGLLVTHFGLGVEVENHPCMAPLTLPPMPVEPAGEPPADPPELAGTAISLDALERMLGAAWLGGLACGGGPRERALLRADELAPFWPGLGRILAADPEATLGLELWPEGLPKVSADPYFANTLSIETGRVRIDLIASFQGARWRLATVTAEIAVRGQLATDGLGFMHFDALDATTLRLSAEPGLIEPPDTLLTDAVTGPLFDALLAARPFGRLPPALRPPKPVTWTVDDAYAVLPWLPPAPSPP